MSAFIESIYIQDGDRDTQSIINDKRKLENKPPVELRGEVELVLKTFDRKTNRVIDSEVVEKKNLLLYVGLNHLSHMLVGDATEFLTQIAVGTGNTAPDPGDSGLESEVYRTTFTSIDYPAVGRVRVIANFLDSTLNTMISEAGCFFSNGVVLSRVTFFTIDLTYVPLALIGKELELRWTYSYI